MRGHVCVCVCVCVCVWRGERGGHYTEEKWLGGSWNDRVNKDRQFISFGGSFAGMYVAPTAKNIMQ
jgi:hypothetical protein